MLDDILAALDVHTARRILDKCLNGHLLAGRTVLLVTHNLSMLGRLAGRVVAVSSQGIVSVRETADDAIADDVLLISDIAENDKIAEHTLDDGIDELKEPALPAGGGLIADEEVALGHVSLSACEANNTRHKVSAR